MPRSKAKRPRPFPSKSQTTTLLWNVLFGGFGADQFYEGNVAQGVAHLVLIAVGIALIGVGTHIRGLSLSDALRDADDPAQWVAQSSALDIGAALALLGWALILVNALWAVADGLALVIADRRIAQPKRAWAAGTAPSTPLRLVLGTFAVLRLTMIGSRAWDALREML